MQGGGSALALPGSIILASSSPRRRELLERIGLSIEVVPSPFEEELLSGTPREEAERLARGKVEELLQRRPELGRQVVLGADTLIEVGGRILGKAATEEEADAYLSLLSGREHRVITGLAISIPPSSETGASAKDDPTAKDPRTFVKTEITSIRLALLSSRERTWYIKTGEWKGAAGAYRIQGLGALFVERIDGCYYNVMGLPLQLFYGMLREHGYELLSSLSGESSAV